MAKTHIAGLDPVRFWAACSILMVHLAVVSWSARQGVNWGIDPDYPELDIFRSAGSQNVLLN
jgi:hypothetical protein